MERVIWRSLLSQRNTKLFSFSLVQSSRSDSQRTYSSDDDKSGVSSKRKLKDLLESIVKEAQDKTRGEVPTVNFKLAVPLREKRSKPDKRAINDVSKEAEAKISPNLLSAVKSVAANLEGDPQTIETELVQKLKTQQAEKINLSELFLGMKIDRSKKPTPSTDIEIEGSRAQRVRRILGEADHYFEKRHVERQGWVERRPRQNQGYPYTPIDLFGSKPLGIFLGERKASPPNIPTLSTWDKIQERELKLKATHPPANGFEEMILWTEQEKFWKFPIDNEQGLTEVETKYDFTDHVFLEPVIESWCPKKGPVRHFMELVTVALSKNPYLTVPEKHEYLNWYHEYFKGKSHILKEVGAGEVQ